MSNFLSPGGKGRGSQQQRPETALRIQSAANGVARPYGYGQGRLASNLLWYGNFIPTFVPASSAGGGGKGVGGGSGGGGGKGGGPSGGAYTYTAGVAFGICEGPIDQILQAWESKSAVSLAAIGLTVFRGDYGQTPWPALQTIAATYAQNFRGIAYAADMTLSLGSSSELPNMSFDVRFAIADALTETFVIPPSAAITPEYFDWEYGVTDHVTVPYAAPYQVVSQYAPGAANSVPGVSGIAATIDANNVDWFTNAFGPGVVYDVGATNGTFGQPLTQVPGTPGQGQFNVSPVSPYEFTFSAADAGQPVALILAMLSPGVSFAEQVTGTLTAGSGTVTGIPSMAAVAVGARVLSPNVPLGAFVQALTSGSATGGLTLNSPTVTNVAGKFTAQAGSGVSDSAGVIPAGATVESVTPTSITLGALAATTAAAESIFATSAPQPGTWSDTQFLLYGVPPAACIPGAQVVSLNFANSGIPALTVESVAGSVVTVTSAEGAGSGLFGAADEISFVLAFTGDVLAGSNQILNPSSLTGLDTTCAVADAAGAFAGAPIDAITIGSILLSANAIGNAPADTLTFANSLVLSTLAMASGSATLTLVGLPMQQVITAPAQGEYTLSALGASFGRYNFNAADIGKLIVVTDLPDANPADVLVDFLTNPYYGLTQFSLSRIGDLSKYRAYCLAAGLLVSPIVSTQSAANSFVSDLMKATNSEIVWSGGLLTVVPYGDTALSANGAVYSPPTAPLYELDDDDFLPNQGTNSASAAASGSPDPITITRLDPAAQENDIKVEYLDRSQIYNPAIAEAKDDAAIEIYGLKSSGSKQLHLFCEQKAALMSAQLMLGRQQVRRTFSVTVGREYILLDPMDIVAINDPNAGLVAQWVRITEITENDDRSLSITAEEYLEGAASAPVYPMQRGAPTVQNYTLTAPDALAPMFFDAPVQIGNVLGMEAVMCTNGSGGDWGGCDIWLSLDGVNFTYFDTLLGGTTMGVLTANLPGGTDPDQVHTLAVDLTESQGTLSSGTQADADNGNTLCAVGTNAYTTLARPMAAGDTVALVASNAGFPGNGFTFWVDQEQVLVTAGATTNAWTVSRGRNGTTAAAHAVGANVSRAIELVSYTEAELTAQYKYALT